MYIVVQLMYDSSIQGTFTNLGEIKQAWAIVIKFEDKKINALDVKQAYFSNISL